MYDDGKIEIDMNWPSQMSDIKAYASNYAALISVINYGGFKDDIIKILLDAKNKYSQDKKNMSYLFITYTLNRISEAQKITELNSDRPLISPKQAFTSNIDHEKIGNHE